MVRTLLYGILLGVLTYALLLWRRALGQAPAESETAPKARQRYRIICHHL